MSPALRTAPAPARSQGRTKTQPGGFDDRPAVRDLFRLTPVIEVLNVPVRIAGEPKVREVDPVRPTEPWGRDSNHTEGEPVHHQGRSQNVRAASIQLLPEPIADDDDPLTGRLRIVGRVDEAPSLRLHSEEPQVFTGDERAIGEDRRRARRGHSELHHPLPVQGETDQGR